MIIQHQQNEKKGLFLIELDHKIIAEMTYVMAGTNKMIIDHTEVSPTLSGQGIGKQLVKEAVNFARQQKIKILPLCPFAKAIFEKELDYQDVLF